MDASKGNFEYFLFSHNSWESEDAIYAMNSCLLLNYSASMFNQKEVIKIEEIFQDVDDEKYTGIQCKQYCDNKSNIRENCNTLKDQICRNSKPEKAVNVSKDLNMFTTTPRSSNKLYTCKVCYKHFPSDDLKHDVNISTTPFVCDECGKIFSRLKSSVTHPGKRPYQCEVCWKRFSKCSNLMSHTRTHIEETNCEVCGKFFRRSRDLKRHTIMHTKEETNCVVCGKCFSSTKDLKRHTRTHTQETNCEVCGKCFRRPCDLKRHKRTHTGEKTKCEICGKCFSRPWYLKRHIQTHNVENKTCEVCGKCFSRSWDLKRHTRIHTGERPYKCEQCGKCFIQSTYLKRHTRKHAAEKQV